MAKIVIVGAVGGGATVASQIRRYNKECDIDLYDKNGYVAFSNCGMPYVVGGVVEDREEIIPDAEEFSQKYDVRLHLHHEVIEIKRDQKTIIVRNDTKTFEVAYDTLILSPGGHAVLPDIPGSTLPQCFRLRTIEQMDHILHYIKENSPKTAVIVGGGAIGVEMAEALQLLEIKTTILERNKHVMSRLDSFITEGLANDLVSNGITIVTEDEVLGVRENKEVETKHNGNIQADMVLFSIGIHPNTDLAVKANLTIGETSGIKVSEVGLTNDPSIYALGDAVEVTHHVTNQPFRVPLAWPAHRQAFVVANHIAGNNISYSGSQATSIVKGFDYVVASTGATTAQLKAANIDFGRIEHESKQHAGYYPGAHPIRILVFYEKGTKKILGAQVGGTTGVDKRIDVLSAFILLGGKVDQLAELEIAYAPPFSSPKDPLNIVGYKSLDV